MIRFGKIVLKTLPAPPYTRTIFSGSSVNRTPATVLEAVGPQEYTLDIESRLRV